MMLIAAGARGGAEIRREGKERIIDVEIGMRLLSRDRGKKPMPLDTNWRAKGKNPQREKNAPQQILCDVRLLVQEKVDDVQCRANFHRSEP